MDKNPIAYDNAACCVNDGDGTQKPSMEMERVVVGDCRLPVAKCCDTSNGNNCNSPNNKFPNAPGTTPTACLPKCPAVKTSPWDPIKTRIALCLAVAIVIWLLIGVAAQNF